MTETGAPDLLHLAMAAEWERARASGADGADGRRDLEGVSG